MLLDINHMKIFKEGGMNPMKKKLVGLLAAIMVLGSATTALAAPSISAGDLSNNAGSVTKVESMTDEQAKELAEDLVVKKESIEIAGGKVTAVETKAVEPKVLKAAAKEAVKAVEKLFNVDLDKKVGKGETKVTAAIAAIMDIVISGEVSKENPATLTFDIPEAKAGENYLVLHQLADGTWEQITPEVRDGKIIAKFTSFSPVAIVKVAATTEKTGVVSVLPMIAAAGLVGTVVCGKKVKFN